MAFLPTSLEKPIQVNITQDVIDWKKPQLIISSIIKNILNKVQYF